MIRGVSLDWLRTVCSTSTGNRILLFPACGLEVAFFPTCTHIDICFDHDVQRAWILLLISSMEHLKRTGLETLLGLNKAGRRVFLYHQLRSVLDEETRKYWDRREKMIRVGLLFDEELERLLVGMRYPKGSVRWNLLGRVLLGRWLENQRQSYVSSQMVFERMSARKDSMWCLPWRHEQLLAELPEHQKKSILPKISRVRVHDQKMTDRIKSAEENSIDLFLLWDSIERIKEIWPYVQRAGTEDAFALVASKEEEPDWWSFLAPHVVSYTSDTHFSFGRVSWLRVHQKSDIHTLE